MREARGGRAPGYAPAERGDEAGQRRAEQREQRHDRVAELEVKDGQRDDRARDRRQLNRAGRPRMGPSACA